MKNISHVTKSEAMHKHNINATMAALKNKNVKKVNPQDNIFFLDNTRLTTKMIRDTNRGNQNKRLYVTCRDKTIVMVIVPNSSHFTRLMLQVTPFLLKGLVNFPHCSQYTLSLAISAPQYLHFIFNYFNSTWFHIFYRISHLAT